jgi:hypothetical protein
MTGPEHYSYAEQLLDMAGDDDIGSKVERYHVAAAQVHATLALAAAFACARLGELPVWDADAWQDTAGTQPSPQEYGDSEPGVHDQGPEVDGQFGQMRRELGAAMARISALEEALSLPGEER